MPDVVELRAADIDSSFAAAWDALPAARGTQADIYDSHAWYASWLSTEPEATPDTVRIPAVVDGGRPIAILPLVVSAAGRRADVLGMRNRTRARPVIGTEWPQAETLGLLAEAVARCGARDLNLHRMPSGDPAAALFVDALRAAGFRVAQHERSCDNLAPAEQGWADYARTFKRFAGYAKRFRGRLESLWDVSLETYGATPHRPALHGFGLYEELHRRSWKGELSPPGRMLRTSLLERAEANGWARVFVLRIAGVPAAAHIWFRLGHVATWLSTAYDQRLAALSPGTVIMWHAQSALFSDQHPPRLVDLLPGPNPQKDRLTSKTPPLLVTEAIRPTVWSGVAVPCRRKARRVQAAVVTRVRARRQQSVPAHRPARLPNATAIPSPGGGSAYALAMTAAQRRYLATAMGHAAPEKMASSWDAADEWWVTGDGPDGIVRVNCGQDGIAVREIVRLDPAADPQALLAALAAVLGQEISVREVALHDAVLPWPRTWQPVEVGGQR